MFRDWRSNGMLGNRETETIGQTKISLLRSNRRTTGIGAKRVTMTNRRRKSSTRVLTERIRHYFSIPISRRRLIDDIELRLQHTRKKITIRQIRRQSSSLISRRIILPLSLVVDSNRFSPDIVVSNSRNGSPVRRNRMVGRALTTRGEIA